MPFREPSEGTMYDFETLLDEVLKSKPELGRENLMRRIQEKKGTVGSGYLTDQGALFLIAGELGVQLEQMTSSDLRLKDLYVGANDITVVARVLAVYPVAEFDRKDGGKGKYRRVILFDGENTARMTLWDERTQDMDEVNFEAGAPVRVVSGYVKQGLDGKPTLNLGKRGSIQKVADKQVIDKLARLDEVAKKIDDLKEEQNLLAVDAVISSETKSSTFTRSDGSMGSLTQFRATGSDGKNERRIVVWNPWKLREVKPGDRVRVTNLRVKGSSGAESELHGDSGTAILLPSVARPGCREFRVASIYTDKAATSLLVVNAKRQVLEVELLGEAVEASERVKVADTILVAPDGDEKGRLRCTTRGSVEFSSGAKGSLPELESLSVKVNELSKMSGPVMIEAIALSKGTEQDVRLKDGSSAKKGELVIGDETGEVKLIGWREQGGKVAGIEPGERLRVVGATPQNSKLGILTLQMSYLTRIEKLHSR